MQIKKWMICKYSVSALCEDHHSWTQSFDKLILESQTACHLFYVI